HDLFAILIGDSPESRLHVDAASRRCERLGIAVDRTVRPRAKVAADDDGLAAERRRDSHTILTPRKSRPASSRYCRALGARPRMPPPVPEPSPNVMLHLPSEMDRRLSRPARSVPSVSRSCSHHSTCAHVASFVASPSEARPKLGRASCRESGWTPDVAV